MNCRDIKERIPLMVSYYIDREMPGHEAEEFEKHLQDCSSCRKLYEEARGMAGAFLRTPRITGNPMEAYRNIKQRKPWWSKTLPFKPRKWVYASLFAALIALLWVIVAPPRGYDSNQVAVGTPAASHTPYGGGQSGVGPGLPFGGSGGNAPPAATPTPPPLDTEIRTAQSTPEPGGGLEEETVTYDIRLNESEYEVNLKGADVQLISLEIREDGKELQMNLEEREEKD